MNWRKFFGLLAGVLVIIAATEHQLGNHDYAVELLLQAIVMAIFHDTASREE